MCFCLSSHVCGRFPLQAWLSRLTGAAPKSRLINSSALQSTKRVIVFAFVVVGKWKWNRCSYLHVVSGSGKARASFSVEETRHLYLYIGAGVINILGQLVCWSASYGSKHKRCFVTYTSNIDFCLIFIHFPNFPIL